MACLTSRILRPASYNPHYTYHVLCPTSHIPPPMSLILCSTYLIICPTSWPTSCVLCPLPPSHVLLHPASYVPYPMSQIPHPTSYVPHSMLHITCPTFWPRICIERRNLWNKSILSLKFIHSEVIYLPDVFNEPKLNWINITLLNNVT